MGCLRLLLSRVERGTSGCGSRPHGPAPQGTTLCVSTCGACEHLTVSHAWSPGQEARDLGPGNDPRTYSKSLPTCCRAFSNFRPNLSRKTFVSASDSLSAHVSLRLQSALQFFPGDISSHGHHLSDPQIMSFIPSLILCKFLGNSNPTQTSLGQGSRHWIQNQSMSIPTSP